MRWFFLTVCLFLMTTPQVWAEEPAWFYTIRPGDTLWDLSETYLHSMDLQDDLQKLNQIQDPKHLVTGTRLRIPLKWLKIHPVPVRVLAVSGTVTVKPGDGSKDQPVKVHQLLQIEDELVTGTESSALLQFADGSQILVQSDSILKLDVVNIYGETGMVDTRVRLKNGRVESDVVPGENGPGERFEIHTPGAISSVRGTALRVTSISDIAVARTEVLSGVLDVVASGQTVEVSGGFGTVVKFGQPPSVPKRLLSRPDLSGLPKRVLKLPETFSWPILDGAAHYRVQIASDNDLLHFEMDRRVDIPAFPIEHLDNGNYVLRIRGIDQDDLEGMNAIHRFSIDIKPVPATPSLMFPQRNNRINKKPSFKWTLSNPASIFHFQLSKTETFEVLLVDQNNLTESTYKIDIPLSPGKYFWRVAAANSRGVFSPFSAPTPFYIEDDPFHIILEPVVFLESHILIEWRANRINKQYTIQVAKDPEFEKVILEHQTQRLEASLVIPYSGDYFVRVISTEKEGLAGAVSTVRSFKVPCGYCWLTFFLGMTGILVLL